MSKEEDLKIAYGFTLAITMDGEIRVVTVGAGHETVASDPISSLSKTEVSRAIKEALDRRADSFRNCKHFSALFSDGWRYFNVRAYNDGRRCQTCGRLELMKDGNWVEDEVK